VILRGLLLAAGALGITGAVAHAFSKAKEPKTSPVQPAGKAQPPGAVAQPAPPPVTDGDPLHTTARLVLTALKNGATRNPVPAVRNFQVAYNGTRPPPAIPLATDGKYGPKCQAALQATLGSAPVPENAFGGANVPGLQAHAAAPQGSANVGRITVAGPAVAPASPLPSSIQQAASVLAGLSYLPKTSDVRVATFQKAYNATSGVLQLPVDGKYSGATQAALQSVLNWMGSGQQAPANAFGMVAYVGSPPVYPPGQAELGQLHAALSTQGLVIDSGTGQFT
jgi:hypothetical protein